MKHKPSDGMCWRSGSNLNVLPMVPTYPFSAYPLFCTPDEVLFLIPLIHSSLTGRGVTLAPRRGIEPRSPA